MAGTIWKMKSDPEEQRRPIHVLLLSDGSDQKLHKLFSGQMRCEWHNNEIHDFHMTPEQVNWARKVEFIAALQKLGVDKLFIANDALGIDNGRYNPLLNVCIDIFV
jgi:hypothetical protein